MSKKQPPPHCSATAPKVEPEQNANELLDRVQAATERYAQWRGAKPGTDPLSIEAIERGLPRAKDELDAAMRELEIARGDYVGLGAAGPLSSGRSVHVSVSRSSAQDAAIIAEGSPDAE